MSSSVGDARRDDLPAGTAFGRHVIVRRLAVGGMAVVYEARHLDLQKRVALKVMREVYASQPALVQRFVLEARAASRLQHPHVISVSDVGIANDLPYYVMDFLEGEDLYSLIQREGPLAVDRVADVMLPVLSAVAAAHGEGILHRDLKPENIFLSQGRHSRVHPRLLDFGISKAPRASSKGAAAPRSLTPAGEAVGTPAYMSPEQLYAVSDLDGRADQFALGVILYEATTLRQPYPAETLEALALALARGAPPVPSLFVPTIPQGFDALVKRAISPAREGRFESIREMGRALWPFASPIGQAIWAEEFGDPHDLAARIAAAPRSVLPTTRPPSIPGPVRSMAPTRTPPVRPSSAASPAVQPGTATERETRPASSQPSAPAAIEPASVRPAELRRFPAFESCDEAELAELVRITQPRRLPRGARVVTQGAHGSGCFLLVTGEVEVTKSTSVGTWTLGRLSAGSVFGQISLVDHVPRTATVTVTQEALVVPISREVYEKLLASTSEVALSLREHIVIAGIRQLRRATRRLTQLREGGSAQMQSAEAQRELLFVQAAAQEWGLPIPTGDE